MRTGAVPTGSPRVQHARVTAGGMLLLAALLFVPGCGNRVRIKEVSIPIPPGMTETDKVADSPFSAFVGPRVSFEGRVLPAAIVAFYEKEMPARGWTSFRGIGMGMPSYSRKNRTLMGRIVTRQDGVTILTLMLAGTAD